MPSMNLMNSSYFFEPIFDDPGTGYDFSGEASGLSLIISKVGTTTFLVSGS
jgi:hypothetical protein